MAVATPTGIVRFTHLPQGNWDAVGRNTDASGNDESFPGTVGEVFPERTEGLHHRSPIQPLVPVSAGIGRRARIAAEPEREHVEDNHRDQCENQPFETAHCQSPV
jgi:hypothetical protein